MDIPPDGKHVYIVAAKHDVIAYWTRNGSTGGLSNAAIAFNVANLDSPRAVSASPDGKFVYAAAAGKIVFWKRDGSTGALSSPTVVKDASLNGASSNKKGNGVGVMTGLRVSHNRSRPPPNRSTAQLATKTKS